MSAEHLLPRVLPSLTREGWGVSQERSAVMAVLGDCQPPLARMPFAQVTRTIMKELRLLKPDAVLYTGDQIWGFGETAQEMRNGYDRFRALAETTGVPFYAVPGNHEMQSDPAAIELFDATGQARYGSFDLGPYHVIGLNTEDFCLEGRVSGEQRDWLEADLATHADAAGSFVFMHRPLYSWFQGDFNPDDAEALHGLFVAHGVKAVFAGHDHFFDEQEHGGVRYFTVGGGGATVYAQPPRGGFSHYLLVHLGESEPQIDVVEPGHLEVQTVAGNDGFEPVTRVRVMNTTERRLVARNLELRAPRLSSSDFYRLSTDYIEFDGSRVEVDASIRDVVDNGDGSVTLCVELPLGDGAAFYVTAEAHEPR